MSSGVLRPLTGYYCPADSLEHGGHKMNFENGEIESNFRYLV